MYPVFRYRPATPVSGRDVRLLLLLAALWGASFLFIRVASPVLGPLPLVAARTAIAGLVLLPLVGEAGRRALVERWPRLLVLGVLNAALPFVLIAFATLTITASLASILNATTPLFTALVARAQLGERVGRGQALGFGVGVAGVALARRPRLGRRDRAAAARRRGVAGGRGVVCVRRGVLRAPAARLAGRGPRRRSAAREASRPVSAVAGPRGSSPGLGQHCHPPNRLVCMLGG